MGHYSGYIAMYATLASRDVDFCLIPESPFYLEGPGGLFEYIAKRLKENGHMVIVIAEGAGQELLSERLRSTNQQDAFGNKLLRDGGLWKQPVLECCGEREAVKRKFSFIHSCLFCCCSWLP